MGTGRRPAGTDLRHPDHARRPRRHQALCGRLHPLRPRAFRTDVPRHGNRLRHRRIQAGGDCPALQGRGGSSEHPPASTLLGGAERKVKTRAPTAQSHQNAHQRTEGADHEDDTRGRKDVAHTDQRRYDAARSKAHGTEQRRGRAGILPLAFHRQGCARGERHAHAEQQAQHQHLVNPETASRHESRALEHRHDGHAATARQRAAFRAVKLDRQSSRHPDSQRIDTETEAEGKGRETVMLLHNEGRGSDVGKQHTLGEGHLKNVAHVAPVAQNDTETAERIAPPLGRTPVAGQRLPEVHTPRQQQDAQPEQNPENALPAYQVGQQSAHDGSRHRSHPVDGTDDSQHLGQLAPGKLVRGHGTRNDDAARPRNALQQTEGHKLLDAPREQTQQRGGNEQPHGHQQRQTASVAVAQRAKEHLPHRQTNHTGRQSQLYHRRSGTEIIAHRGQAGQIHVGDERTESGQHAQQYQQEYFGIFFCHTIYISLKSAAKLPRIPATCNTPHRCLSPFLENIFRS